MNNLKDVILSKKWELIGSLLLLAIFIVPAFSMAGNDKIYVDDDATGTEDGSSDHPYSTIKKALKQADENDEVHIRAGSYKENIEIPKGVAVYGSDKDEVTIKAKDENDPAVKMNHKTKLNKVTVKNGDYGVQVGKNDKISIIECVIKDSKKDGIYIKEGDIDDSRKVSITDSVIENNGRAGIYSEKRRLIIVDNEIINNDKDGIDISAGARTWINGNSIKNNNGSGLKLVLDGSENWIKRNTFRDNDREGIEVNALGNAGRIDIKDSRLYKNGRYGIVKVQRGNFAANVWDGLTIQSDNSFWENKFGDSSAIIKL